MKSLLAVLSLIVAALTASPAHAVLNVLACEPEWAALAKELAGDQARTFSRPRRCRTRTTSRRALPCSRRHGAPICWCVPGPSWRSGGCRCCSVKRGTPTSQDGRPGYFEASSVVAMLERPASVDRSMGDVHAAGNPHVHLDPRDLLRIAGALSQRLSELDPAHADAFAKRLEAFQLAFRRRHRAMGERGCGPAWPARGRAPQRPLLSLRLARPRRRRRPGAETRYRTLRRRTSDSCSGSSRHSRRRWCCGRATSPRGRATGSRRRRRSRQWCCPTPSAARTPRRTFSPCSTTPSTG